MRIILISALAAILAASAILASPVPASPVKGSAAAPSGDTDATGTLPGRTASTDAPSPARAVALVDAKRAPSVLYYVPGARVPAYRAHSAHSPSVRCPRGTFPTDVSAYRWNGRALAGQRWNRDHTLTFWNVKRGPYHVGRVSYDGDRFWNESARPVLVAAWCD